MDVNSIVCCGFNKSYSTLPKSRSGSLGNSQLYEAALFAYQNLVFQRHIDMEYSCISESDFDTFSQKLQGCCGCCGVDNDTDTELTLAYQSCPICFTVVGFTDDPQNDGIYVDPDSNIVVVRDNGVYQPFFELVAVENSPGTIGTDYNFSATAKITNPNSPYYDMVAISRLDNLSQSNIQIWDFNISQTPQLITTFNFTVADNIFGPIAYEYATDRIYFSTFYKSLYYLDLATGIYQFVLVLPPFGPYGNVVATGISINPVTNKRYITATGTGVNPPNAGGLGIFSSSDVYENSFPFDSIYTTPDPTIDLEFAVAHGIAFDSAGYAYVITATNSTDYTIPYTQRDIVKLDPLTNEVVGILNYDTSLTWIPLTYNNDRNQTAIQYYDGTAKLQGEKILAIYRNNTPLRAEVVGSISGTVLTVTSVISGSVLNGAYIVGPGISPFTAIISFGTGTGGVGTYNLNNSQTVGPITINVGPSSSVGNITAPSNASRIVAFDTQAPYNSTVLFDLPDSIYGGVYRFFYSKHFNKFFIFSLTDGTRALDFDGNVLYLDLPFPLNYSGYSYQFYDFPSSNRVMTYSAANISSTPDNIFVIEPPLFCENGRIYVENQGTYEFNGGEWVPMVQTQNVSNSGNQWNVSAVFNQTAVLAKLQYTTDLISWTDIEPVTGGLYHDPSEWLSGLVFVINTELDIWFRIAIANDDDCLNYGDIFPDPPPSPNFESSPLTVYRYNDVQYTDLSVGVPQSWSWTFESGTPATSTTENPLVTYNTAGTFDVSLSVTNINGTRTKTVNNYVTVNEGFLLNYIPGSSVGYSMRQINIAYTGPCIRVRRDSDNTEQDIPFANGELDLQALSTFCGTDNGYVVYWYDQSGNGNDLFNLTTSEQPQIYSLGLPILQNGKPCVQFDGSDDNMNMLTAVVVTATSASIVAAHTNTTGIRPLIGTDVFNQISLVGGFGMGIAASSSFDTFVPSTSTNQGLFTIHRNGLAAPNTLRSGFRDGVQLSQSAALLTNQTGTYTAMAGAPGGNRFTGKVQEVIIWNGYKASKNTFIQDNVNDYFNIY